MYIFQEAAMFQTQVQPVTEFVQVFKSACFPLLIYTRVTDNLNLHLLHYNFCRDWNNQFQHGNKKPETILLTLFSPYVVSP